MTDSRKRLLLEESARELRAEIERAPHNYHELHYRAARKLSERLGRESRGYPNQREVARCWNAITREFERQNNGRLPQSYAYHELGDMPRRVLVEVRPDKTFRYQTVTKQQEQWLREAADGLRRDIKREPERVLDRLHERAQDLSKRLSVEAIFAWNMVSFQFLMRNALSSPSRYAAEIEARRQQQIGRTAVCLTRGHGPER